MKLEKGTLLGSYSVGELLGSGGMGEVYRAWDTRLKREVAIKVLSERRAEDPTAIARFEREAQSVAALSHPNILAIHEFGHDGGLSFAVMELLEGETLRMRMDRIRLSSEKTLEIARQIVGGLIAAHDRSVVHRDLKPQNIFLTRDGLVKILDFGLAKREPVSFLLESDSAAPTFGHSTPGSVVGTIDYMSPEQVRGRPVDHRTDIFAFGVILYEMFSGVRPFLGESAADIVGAILREEPRDISEFNLTIPRGLCRIVSRCLEKDVRERFQTARDLAFALDAAAHEGSEDRLSGVVPLRPRTDEVGSSVAVLPFTNMSSDPDQDYFCEGMAEEIINSLTNVAGLRVAARSSAFRFNPKTHDAREVGVALHVKAVLEGSVRTAGPRIRVTVQLINVADGFQLWSERYDRELDDIFALQDEISENVVEALKIKLATEGKGDANRPTTSIEAYRLYLKGLHNWYRRERDSLAKAASFFELSARKDPSYALAHAGVANAYSSLAIYGLDPRRVRPKVDAAIARAVELGPQVPEVHMAVGYKLIHLDWDWKHGEAELRAAVESVPSNPLALCWYSFALTAMPERRDEAVTVAKRAREIDPLSPYTNSIVASALLWVGRFEESLGALTEAVDIDPDFFLALFLLTATLGALGRFDEAVSVSERAALLSGRSPFYLGWLGWAHAIAGHRDRAKQIIDELHTKAEGGYVRPLGLVQIYSGLGEVDTAFDWLEKALAVGDPFAYLLNLPYMDPLRDDARFVEVRRRVGIPA